MLRTTLAGLRAHSRRLVATAVAVILGVGFVIGTLIFTDTAEAGFFDTFARVAKNVDVSVLRPERAGKQDPPLLAADLLGKVRGLTEVDHADGRVSASLPLLDHQGRPIVNFGRAGYTVSTDGDARLRAFDITGRVPASDTEAVLDTETAAHQRYAVGDTVTVLDRDGGRHAYTLVGLIDFGVSKDYSGFSVVGLPQAQIATLTGVTGYDEIVVTAKSGVTQTRLAGLIRRQIPPPARVFTGDQRRIDLADSAASVATQFTFILLIFGAISLVVAVFVIYNTFAILLAQRVRDTALLRCVGATRRQIFGATVLEAAIVGLGGGAMGVLFGVGVAYSLFLLLNNGLNAGLPTHSLIVGVGPILIGLVTGLVVTVLAALMPAVRATRTSPLAALRDMPTVKVASRARRIARLAVALAIGGAGAAVTAAGSSNPDPQTGTFIIVGGGLVAFLGVLIAAPLFVGPLTALVGAPAKAVAGTPAEVAVANTRRNPGRAAVTTATLMIGISLMSLFSVLLSSIKQTAGDQIIGHYPVDYVIAGVSYDDGRQAPIPTAFAQALRDRAEVGGVSEVRQVSARVDGSDGQIAAVDPGSLGTLIKPDLKTGTLDALRTGTAIVSTTRPMADTIAVTVNGKKTTLAVVGRADLSVPGAARVDVLVAWDQLAALTGPGDDSTVMVKAARGVDAVSSRDAIEAVAASYPLLRISSVADLSGDLENAVNGLIGLFSGLVATAVVIALFGIANTLSLSVVERTRESATLRAIGLTRPQLRGTLLIEALLMGVVGGLVGVVYGLIYGPLVVRKALENIGPTIVVPWTWVIGLIVVAAAASCLAAVLPARKAAKASIIAAMADV
jgi:putative ABC transport system permease protein